VQIVAGFLPQQGLAGPARSVDVHEVMVVRGVLDARSPRWSCAVLERDRLDRYLSPESSTDNERVSRLQTQGLELSTGVVVDDLRGAVVGAALARANLLRTSSMAGGCADADPRDTAMAAVALFTAGRSYVEVVLTGAQLHGGIGTTVDHVPASPFSPGEGDAVAMRETSQPAARDSRHVGGSGEGSWW
jgi:hypothetical protein